MFEISVLTGLILAGVVIGVLRTRKGNEKEMPSPFNRR